MNTHSNPDQDERISAYLDGELSPEERAEVERRIAEDPRAHRLYEELQAVQSTVRQSSTVDFNTDLASSVMAEALRRQADTAVEVADRLEPEGEFGLPFGKSSRTWAWAGVAAAAAVMISFYGRPDAPPPRQNTIASSQANQLDRRLVALQRANPNLQVVSVNATPQQLQRLAQRLSMQRAETGRLPVALANANQSGVMVEPSARVSLVADQEEQFVYVDAEQAELDRLLAELEQEGGGVTFTVEGDGASQAAKPPQPVASQQPTKINAVPIQIRLVPNGSGAANPQAAPQKGQRTVFVLKIRISQQKPAAAR